MERRQLLRVLGGGAIVAASGGLAGCASRVPDSAVAAWSGPAAGESDPRRWALSWALLAPHSHNLQSWLVDLRTPDVIVLYCDRTRLLPETDPHSRQMMMSQGTFLELLDLALRERGFRAETTLFPDGAFGPHELDDRPVARVRLVADDQTPRDPLFAQIPHRRTNREPYAPGQPVSEAAWAAMRAAAGQRFAFGHTAAGDTAALAEHRRIAAEAWRIELTTPAKYLESARWFRIGADEIAQHRDGLALTSALPVWMSRLGLFDRNAPLPPDSMALRGQIDGFNEKLATTPAFLWLTSPDNARATQVEAGRAYARVQLAATAHGVSMQPLSQALQEYPEVEGPYREIHRLLGATAPQTVQMWARVGHAPAIGPAPRRGLQAHLMGAAAKG